MSCGMGDGATNRALKVLHNILIHLGGPYSWWLYAGSFRVRFWAFTWLLLEGFFFPPPRVMNRRPVIVTEHLGIA